MSVDAQTDVSFRCTYMSTCTMLVVRISLPFFFCCWGFFLVLGCFFVFLYFGGGGSSLLDIFMRVLLSFPFLL